MYMRARVRVSRGCTVKKTRDQQPKLTTEGGGLGGRNSASNTMLASDEWLGRMDVWGCGRLAREPERVEGC